MLELTEAYAGRPLDDQADAHVQAKGAVTETDEAFAQMSLQSHKWELKEAIEAQEKALEKMRETIEKSNEANRDFEANTTNNLMPKQTNPTILRNVVFLFKHFNASYSTVQQH